MLFASSLAWSTAALKRRVPLQHLKKCWQVSSFGRLCNTKGVISNGSRQADGYMVFGICGQKWRVHRVVKVSFHGLPMSKDTWQVHHLDGNKCNNCLENLEYVTSSENMCHSYSNPSRRNHGPAQSKPVLWRPKGSISWTTSPSAAAVAQQLRMHKDTVSKCCREVIAAKGYEFKYPDFCQQTLPGEEWRQLVDPLSSTAMPAKMVSSFGRITSRGLISRGHLTQEGYYRTRLSNNASSQVVFVHRLVALAFLGPPPSHDQRFVNHKDLDKGNNTADNLEWVSAVENRAHFLESSPNGHGTTAKPVWSRLHGKENPWRWHHSMASAACDLGLCKSNISKCARGLQQHTGGYEFQLADAQAIVSSLPGEEWRNVDVLLLQRDREIRGLC